MPPPARRTNRRAEARKGKLTDRERAKDTLAEALDVPREMLDGTDGVNHWSDHAPIVGPQRRRSSPMVESAFAVHAKRLELTDEARVRAENAPVPGSYKAEWWPAHVRFPDLEVPARLAKVYATPQGLYVYTRAPKQEDRATGGVPYWYARIDYDKTPRPATGYAARNAGIALFTEVGQVTLTVLGGCGCSNGTLRAWRPQWATRNEAWEV